VAEDTSWRPESLSEAEEAAKQIEEQKDQTFSHESFGSEW